ncbi:MAG: UvrD-helicase domain-containing protein, partial [Phycisphaerae bacterium]
MSDVLFTTSQQEAIHTFDRDVLVSAAAGSGKTAVLAARCVHLVTEAPEPFRCDVDQLLVLTFTEAAASEMRTRIRSQLAEKALENQDDERLRLQVARVGAARISTIHAFCFWLIKRSFQASGIDPGIRLLDESEASLLRAEVLERLWDRLYREFFEAEEPSALARGFVSFVDTYGLGKHDNLAETVLDVHAFLRSLSQPERWLEEVRERSAPVRAKLLTDMLEDFARETLEQLQECRQRTAELRATHEACRDHADVIEHYADALEDWHDRAQRLLVTAVSDSAVAEESFDALLRDVSSYKLPRTKSRRKGDDEDASADLARDMSNSVLKQTREKFFKSRLLSRRAKFSVADRWDGQERVRPVVETIVGLVCAFNDAFEEAKKRNNVLDFSDLEVRALAVLCNDGDPDQPSDVARFVQRRFAHVLVDEYQDINPIQEAIIQLSSRKTEPSAPDNLFVVGDVKQSIYRFRLAEPALFATRQGDFLTDSSPGQCIVLRENFRSRPEILRAVNLMFEPLMQFGTVKYDEAASLVHGRDEKKEGVERRTLPVELHLVERQVQRRSRPENDEQGEAETTAASDGSSGDFGHEEGANGLETAAMASLDDHPADWEAMEREAYLIGRTIQQWQADPEQKVLGRQVRLKDIAILLRSRKVNAERVVSMLQAMGLAAHTEAAGSLLQTVEARDLLAVLQVVDNPRQDIPLAAVLRNGVIAPPLSEDELVLPMLEYGSTEGAGKSRRRPTFHESMMTYARQGPSGPLREKLLRTFGEIERLRLLARHKPLADVLQSIYDCHGYLGYVGGRPNGGHRVSVLQQMLELARQCQQTRYRGVFGFLQFVRDLQESGDDITVQSGSQAPDDAIRVMTIHSSKGLQFPIVFLPGLGNRLNLQDRQGSVIYERNAGLGLRVVDMERRIEYPTWNHDRVAESIDRESREEELRILYVAMTRAEEKLVMLGSVNNAQDLITEAHLGQSRSVSGLTVHTATSAMDWIKPALQAAPDGPISLGRGQTSDVCLEVYTHEGAQMDAWRTASRASSRSPLLASVANSADLPSDEPQAGREPAVEEVLRRLEHTYPFAALTRLPSVLAATETGQSRAIHDEESFSVSAADAEPAMMPEVESPRV